jgi:hypothetical protein
LQVDAPHHPPGTLVEFLRQYAMIVLSILTALALERAVVALHDAGAARDSRARIEAELAQDDRELKQSEHSNAETVKSVRETLKQLVDLLKQGKPDPAKLLPVVKPGLTHFSVSTPSWQHDAWDAAIADQSATHLASSDLHRYAEIYASARDMESTAQLLLGGDWLTRMATLSIDVALNALDARSSADMLARFLLAVSQIDQSQKELEALIGRT